MDDFTFIKSKLKKKSLPVLEELLKDYDLAMNQGKIIKSKKLLKLEYDNLIIWIRKNTSPSTIDLFLEIFKYKGHMKLNGFQGKKDKIILDIGANEGFYTLAMKRNNPKLKIIAVEPIRSTYEILKRNIKSNKLKDVVLVNQAVTSKKGKIDFEIVPEIPAIAASDIGLQKRSWLDKKRVKKIVVKSTTLTDLCKKSKISNIDILKIEVEGSEYEILKSSQSLLKNVKKIVIGMHTSEIRKKCKNFLKKNGFKLVREEKERCGDSYFIRKYK